MREQRKKIAQETLQNQTQGFYYAPSGQKVDIGKLQKYAEENSRLISPEQGREIADAMVTSISSVNNAEKPACDVINVSTVTSIINANEPVAVLNFASAKNPGGGFLNGAMAQEEALAISGGLYNTQLKHMKYYEENRHCNTAMYTDYAIYSPDVPFFRDPDYALLEAPVKASVDYQIRSAESGVK